MGSAFISLPFLVCAVLGVLLLVALPSIAKIGKMVMGMRSETRSEQRS